MKKKTPLPLFGSRGKTKIIIRGDKDKSKDKSKMKSSGFTMKGNPMKRNFGLPTDNMASPMMKEQDSTKKKVDVRAAAEKQKEDAIKRFMAQGLSRAEAIARFKENMGVS